MIQRLIYLQLKDSLSVLMLLVSITVPLGLASMAGRERLEILLVLTLLVFGVVASGIFLRQRLERRQRLLAQLPATRMQISLASWASIALLALVPAGVIFVYLTMNPARPFAWNLAFAVSTYSFVLYSLGAIAIAFKPSPLSGRIARHWKWVPLLLVAVLIFLWANSADTGTFMFLERIRGGLHASQPDWAVLIPVFLGLSAALAIVDGWLHGRAEDLSQ